MIKILLTCIYCYKYTLQRQNSNIFNWKNVYPGLHNFKHNCLQFVTIRIHNFRSDYLFKIIAALFSRWDFLSVSRCILYTTLFIPVKTKPSPVLDLSFLQIWIVGLSNSKMVLYMAKTMPHTYCNTSTIIIFV